MAERDGAVLRGCGPAGRDACSAPCKCNWLQQTCAADKNEQWALGNQIKPGWSKDSASA